MPLTPAALAALTPSEVRQRTLTWRLPAFSPSATLGPVPDLSATEASEQLRPTRLAIVINEYRVDGRDNGVEVMATIQGRRVKSNGTTGARTDHRRYSAERFADLPHWARDLLAGFGELPELLARATQ